MKIKMIAGTAAVLLAGVLPAACGGDGDGDSGDGGNGSSGGGGETRTVVVWDRAGAEATSRQAFFEEWNRKHGPKAGIKIKYEPQATEKYEDILRLAFQTGRGPDVFHAPSAQVGAYASAGWAEPLEGVVDDEILADAEKYLSDKSELVWGGKAYAVPSTTFTVRLGINRGLFEKAGLDPDDPPTTFSEVEKAARAITKVGGGKAYGVAVPMGWVGFLNWTVDLPLLSTDADLAQNGMFNLATSEFEADRYAPVVEHFRKLIADGTAYPGAETLDYDVMLAAMAEGNVGMLLTSGSIVGGLQQLDSKIDFGTGPIPVPDGMSQVRSPMNAGFPYAISTKAADQEAAAAAFQVLVGPEMQEALAKGGIPPLSKEAWDSPAAKNNDWLQLFRPTDQDQQWPKTPGTVLALEGKDALTTIQSLVQDPSADPEAALDDLSQRYKKAYETGVENGEIDPKEFGD